MDSCSHLAVRGVRVAHKGGGYSSLNENPSASPPRMPISWEIDLCNLRIEERTNAFDYVKADVSDALLAQPCHDDAPLQRSRQAAELFDRQTLIFCIGMFGHAFDPSFFFRCNRCRAQDARSDFSTERFFQIGNYAAAKSVTQRSEIFIRSIF